MVEGGGLVRVLAVAHGLPSVPPTARKAGAVSPSSAASQCEIARVIGGGPGIALLGELAAQRQGHLTVMRIEVGEEGGVVRGLDDDRDIAMVLGGGAIMAGRRCRVLDAILVEAPFATVASNG